MQVVPCVLPDQRLSRLSLVAWDRELERAKFYQDRDDKAEQAYKARCDAADAKGKPHPTRPKKKTYAERCAAADLKGNLRERPATAAVAQLK